MMIESIIRRAGGTRVDLDGKTYHFEPSDVHQGKHVCEVKSNKHIQKFLSVPEGFRLANADDEEEDFGGGEGGEGLGDVTGDTLGPEGGEDDGKEGGEELPEDDDREGWAEIFEQKFGRRPHGKWDAERIQKELQASSEGDDE